MQIIVNTKEFNSVLKAHKRVVAGRNTMPILDYALLEATEQGTRLISTDLDTMLITPLQCEVDTAGKVLIPVDNCLKVLKAVKAGNVALTQGDGNKIILSANSLTIDIITLPVEDYPAIPEFASDDAIEPIPLEPSVLKRVVKLVPAAENRYSMTGMLLETHNSGANYLRMVGTDAHRLAIQDCPLISPPSELTAIIPKKTAQLLGGYKEIALIGKWEKKGTITHLLFKADNHTLISRVVDGAYPDYNKPLDVKTQGEIVLDNKPLTEAIEQVLPFCDSQNYPIRFELGNGILKLTSVDSELGEATVSIPVESEVKATWGLNGQYLLEMLKDISEELFACIPQDILSPFLFVDAEVDYRQVIMPVKVD